MGEACGHCKESETLGNVGYNYLLDAATPGHTIVSGA